MNKFTKKSTRLPGKCEFITICNKAHCSLYFVLLYNLHILNILDNVIYSCFGFRFLLKLLFHFLHGVDDG